MTNEKKIVIFIKMEKIIVNMMFHVMDDDYIVDKDVKKHK